MSVRCGGSVTQVQREAAALRASHLDSRWSRSGSWFFLDELLYEARDSRLQ